MVCVATRVCPPSAALCAFQLHVPVALAPAASPVTVCVPIATPAVASVRTTSKLVLTFTPPTFWTVTPRSEERRVGTEGGAGRPVEARAVAGGVLTVFAAAPVSAVWLLVARFWL